MQNKWQKCIFFNKKYVRACVYEKKVVTLCAFRELLCHSSPSHVIRSIR